MTKIKIGLIGAGRIGSFHGTTAAKRLDNAELVAIADPFKENAERLATELGVKKIYEDPNDLLADDEVQAVIIATPARTHSELVIAAAKAGKGIFCEKPMAVTNEEAEKAIEAVTQAGVVLQVGFNRRFVDDFEQAGKEVREGIIGEPQLLRSLTRDPKLNNAEGIPEWTIFLETLIHDFDTLNFLNPNAQPVSVYASADALIRPDLKDKGLLDTAVVTIKYSNGAIATAEANFQAVYGYDVRGEVFGTKGMLTSGSARVNNMIRFTNEGISCDTSRQDTDLLANAYVKEMHKFAECVQEKRQASPTGVDAKKALAIALACIESMKTGRLAKVNL